MHFFTEGSSTDTQLRSWLGSRYEHYRRAAMEARDKRQRDEQRAQVEAQIDQQLRAAEKNATYAEATFLSGIIGGLLGLGLLSSLMLERLI